VQAEQPVLPPRRPYAFGSAHADKAVSGNAVDTDARGGQLLAGQRLHRVTPDARDAKRHVRWMPAGRAV
jgi:hypothetical protein